ncbi:MAG: serine/threonine protein kinase [Firmicutes bacterium]|nr:serine/threonine protein kinase [Bacillota bacterium]
MKNLADEFKNKYDSYEVISQISRNTWQIKLTEYNKIAVLKQVGNADIYKRLKSMQVKGTPKIIGIFEKDGNNFVIEEYISGDSLDEVLKSQGKLSAKQVKHIICSLCDILAPLHKSGIIHRDIKPSNIMLTSSNAVFLIDFGIARSVNAENTSDTAKLGTEFYASPEQYGFKQTDNRSDIYSLGKLMLVLLSGRETADSINRLKYARIIKKCTQVDSDKRFSSVISLKNSFAVIKFKIFLILIGLIIACIFVYHICKPTSNADILKNDTVIIIDESTTDKETVIETTETVTEPSTEATSEAVTEPVSQTQTEVSTTAQAETKSPSQPKPVQETKPVQEVKPEITTEAPHTDSQTDEIIVTADSDGYTHNYGYFGSSTRFGSLHTLDYDIQGTYFFEIKDEYFTKQKMGYYPFGYDDRLEVIAAEADENGISLSVGEHSVYIPHSNTDYVQTQYKPESTFYEVMYYDIGSDGIYDLVVIETGIYDISDPLPLYAVIHPITVNENLELTKCGGDVIALHDKIHYAEIKGEKIRVHYDTHLGGDLYSLAMRTYSIENNTVIQIPDMEQDLYL